MRSALVVAALVTAVSPVAARAQTPPPPQIDPGSSTPAGAEYEIPIERGRTYAAPDRRAKKPEGDRALIRSDTGYGASAQVPGLTANAQRAAKPQPEGARTNRRANGRGQSRTPRHAPGSPAPRVSVAGPTGADPGVSKTWVLLGVACVAGVGAGLIGRRSAH